MAKDVSLEEMRRAILIQWAELESRGKLNTYAFRTTLVAAARLEKVRVCGHWNNNSRRLNRKYLGLVYDRDERTCLYAGYIPADILALLNRTMSESDFDSMEFNREELGGKEVPRLHTFQVEMRATLQASKTVRVRTSTLEEAVEVARKDESLSKCYGWHVTEITKVEVGKTDST